MKHQNTHLLLGIALGLGLTGCALPSVKALTPDPDTTQAAAAKPGLQPTLAGPQQRSEPILYARDGSVVGEQKPGTVAMTPDAGQSAATGEGSRWTLLEQYQSTLEENEGLKLELAALNQALERAQERETELSKQLGALNTELAQSMQRIEKLEGHNLELASRLTTAQIRRLQSEKLLLEAKLDWKRVEATIKGSEAASPRLSPGTQADTAVDPEPQSPAPEQP